jgi:putative FmdB family regulatory protein
MPLYEYKCLECDKIFEFIHGINDNPPEAVDKCEKKNCSLVRIISASNFRVKGPPKNSLTRTGYVNFGTGKDYDCKRPNFVTSDPDP